MLMFETGHTLKFISTITIKKYLILTFPLNLDTKSESKSFFNKFVQTSKDYVNIEPKICVSIIIISKI